jgi:O-acetyl-ADP-ribose deacetylase (regulator of RNase III)
MGKGIAVEFRSRFPAMYVEYKARCADGRFRLGEVFAWHNGDVTVFNLGTQRTWRSKADLGAVKTALTSMVQLAEEMGIRRVGLPRIGAGLGGLPWEDVRSILVGLGASTNVELIVVERYEQVPG